jgi:hypothetical protein
MGKRAEARVNELRERLVAWGGVEENAAAQLRIARAQQDAIRDEIDRIITGLQKFR